MIIRPYGIVITDYQNTVHVIGHDDMFIQFDERKMFRYFVPKTFNRMSKII